MVLKFEFEKKFEIKFRELAMKKYGFSKGAIKKAANEAMKTWIKKEDNTLPTLKNSMDAIKGVMKHFKNKYSSVELQHGAGELWTKKKQFL